MTASCRQAGASHRTLMLTCSPAVSSGQQRGADLLGKHKHPTFVQCMSLGFVV